MKVGKCVCLNILLWFFALYAHAAFALTSYSDLRLLGLADGLSQTIDDPIFVGTFNYSATNPFENDDDNGTIIGVQGETG